MILQKSARAADWVTSLFLGASEAKPLAVSVRLATLAEGQHTAKSECGSQEQPLGTGVSLLSHSTSGWDGWVASPTQWTWP